MAVIQRMKFTEYKPKEAQTNIRIHEQTKKTSICGGMDTLTHPLLLQPDYFDGNR